MENCVITVFYPVGGYYHEKHVLYECRTDRAKAFDYFEKINKVYASETAGFLEGEIQLYMEHKHIKGRRVVLSLGVYGDTLQTLLKDLDLFIGKNEAV